MKMNRMISAALCGALFCASLGTAAAASPSAQSRQGDCIKNNLKLLISGLENTDAGSRVVATDAVEPKNDPVLTQRRRPEAITIAAIPSTPEEFSYIFKRKETAADASDIGTARKALETMGARIPKQQDNATPLCAIERELEASSADYVMLIGHNDGQFFYFPAEDKRASLSTLMEVVERHKKIPIFLTCRARTAVPGSPGATTEISYSQATAIAKDIESYLAAVPENATISPAELAKGIQTVIEKRQRNARVMYVLKTGTKGAAAAGLIGAIPVALDALEDDEEEEKEKPNKDANGKPTGRRQLRDVRPSVHRS